MARIGDLLLGKGILTPERLKEALQAQQRLVGQGMEKLLGDLLIAKGYATPEQIREVLEEQQKEVVVCGACRTQFNIRLDDVGQELDCPRCGRTVRIPRQLKDINVAYPVEPTYIDPGAVPLGYIVVKHFEGEDEVTPLRSGDVIVVGSGLTAQLQVDAKGIDPEHCRLRVAGQDILLENLSQNEGTYVNGQRVDQCTLRVGDLLTLGRYPLMITPGLPSGRNDMAGEVSREHLLEKDPMSLVGSTVGKFRFIRLLGVGGMAKVLLAEQTSLGRLVAVKLLNREMLGTPKAVDRFLREALAGAKLSHPNIVQTYDAGTMGGLLFIAMEYVEGEDLGARIKRLGQLPIPEVLSVAIQVCRGMTYAHAQGVIHRDIKPSNLMFAPDHPVRILDLGIAKLLDETNPESKKVGIGTLVYMPPEQTMDAGAVDLRADIYSLGATLYKMLTARPPFKKRDLRETVRAIRKDPVPDPRLHNSDIPESLSLVLRKALHKDPDDRYSSMKDFQDALLEVWESVSRSLG